MLEMEVDGLVVVRLLSVIVFKCMEQGKHPLGLMVLKWIS